MLLVENMSEKSIQVHLNFLDLRWQKDVDRHWMLGSLRGWAVVGAVRKITAWVASVLGLRHIFEGVLDMHGHVRREPESFSVCGEEACSESELVHSFRLIVIFDTELSSHAIYTGTFCGN